MFCLPTSPAGRRYTARLITTMTVYVLLLFFSVWALKHFHPGHAVTVCLAVLPAIPIIGVIAVVGLYLKEEKDEFQRELLIQAMLWGMGGTLAVTSVWGFLEMNAGSPHFPAFYVFVLFWVIVGIVGIFQSFFYRRGSDE